MALEWCGSAGMSVYTQGMSNWQGPICSRASLNTTATLQWNPWRYTGLSWESETDSLVNKTGNSQE